MIFHGYNIIQAADRLVPTDGGQSYISAVVARFSRTYNLILQNFGSNGLVVIGMFMLFLLIVVIICFILLKEAVKESRKESVPEDEDEAFYAEPEGLYYTIDEEPTHSANDNLPEEPLYDEEEKEKIEIERALSAELVRISQETATQSDSADIRKTMKKDALKENKHIKGIASRRSPKAGKSSTKDIPTGKPEYLSALILTLLSRGVSETKTIQALYFYYKHLFKEEDIFQIVRSIRDFIGLCNAEKFDMLPNIAELPTPAVALLNLGQGNPAQCLVLLQALLNYQMELAELENGNLQDLNYAIAANYSCIIGNISRMTDIDLAHNSFELATELSPKSVKAWNRLGDMYILQNAPEKAFIAFQNVLDIGDPIMYSPQIADAQQYLAAYFEKSGLTQKAEEMREQSNRFYEIYGIRTPLTQGEQIVFQTLLNSSMDNLPTSVAVLLNRTR